MVFLWKREAGQNEFTSFDRAMRKTLGLSHEALAVIKEKA